MVWCLRSLLFAGYFSDFVWGVVMLIWWCCCFVVFRGETGILVILDFSWVWLVAVYFGVLVFCD